MASKSIENEIQLLNDSLEGDNDVIDMEDLETEFGTEQSIPAKSKKDTPEDSSHEGGAQAGGEPDEELSPEQQEIAELKGMLKDIQTRLKKDEPPEDETEETPFVPQVEIGEVDFFEDVSYEDAVDSKEGLVKLLNGVVKKVQTLTQEAVYRNVPQLVKSYADQAADRVEAKTAFYTRHKDLAAHKADVASAATIIANANPGIKRDEFFDKVADYVRYTKGLKKKAEESTPPASSKQSPALVNKTYGRTVKTQKPDSSVGGVQEEIQEMLDALDAAE